MEGNYTCSRCGEEATQCCLCSTPRVYLCQNCMYPHTSSKGLCHPLMPASTPLYVTADNLQEYNRTVTSLRNLGQTLETANTQICEERSRLNQIFTEVYNCEIKRLYEAMSEIYRDMNGYYDRLQLDIQTFKTELLMAEQGTPMSEKVAKYVEKGFHLPESFTFLDIQAEFTKRIQLVTHDSQLPTENTLVIWASQWNDDQRTAPALVKTQSASREKQVKELQMAWKAYLQRKRITHSLNFMLDFPDPFLAHPDYSTEIDKTVVPERLTVQAQATSKRLSRLVLEKAVRDVVILGPRVLTESGDIYLGQWATRKDGVQCRKGKGKLLTTSGALLEGYWSSGKLHWLGRVIYPNGDYYEGCFFQGQRSGKGRFETYEGKTVYIGEWQLDARQGYGTETYADGTHYEGSFQANNMTGKGKFTNKFGVYEGYFEEGRINGYGTYTCFDGRLYEGEFKSFRMHGHGKFRYANGNTYEGEYVDDRKQGYGVYKWEDKLYEGEWSQGKMHGFGYLTTPQRRRRYEFRHGTIIREAPE